MFKSLATIATITSVAFMLNAPVASAKTYKGFQKKHHVQKQVYKKKTYKLKLSQPMIRQKLRIQGYKKIAYTDRRLPVYKVTACKNGFRFKMNLNRFGKIIKRNRVGRCYF